MENKYYTPDISELYVGYETYWIKDHTKELTEDNLILVTFSSKKLASILYSPNQFNPYGTLEFKPDLSSFRTRYLNKDDLLSLGWVEEMILIEDNDVDRFESGYILYMSEDIHYMLFILGDNKIMITYKNEQTMEWKVLYEGLCKSKNELKTILSWIK